MLVASDEGGIMAGLVYALKQVLAGTRTIDEKKKYQVISLCLAVIHFMFVIVFIYMQLKVLYIYNIGVVLFYGLMAFEIGRQNKYTAVFISTFIEIMFHSALASLVLGWDWGFMTYTIGLIPMSFYMSYTLTYLNRSILIPAFASVVVCMVFFSINGLTRFYPPLYKADHYVGLMHRVYSFNTLLTFLFLLGVSVLFSIEIRYMEKHLELENSSLSRVANFDPLTRLMNRRSMNLFLKQAIEEEGIEDGAFCLILADIDDFKRVNDTYGHACGDAVLIQMSEVLRSNVREEDRVCRWGGEEILIFLRGGMEVASQVAQRICDDVASTVTEHEGRSVKVTMTLGVVEFAGGQTIRSMIETADERLYQGKHEGKNRVIYK